MRRTQKTWGISRIPFTRRTRSDPCLAKTSSIVASKWFARHLRSVKVCLALKLCNSSNGWYNAPGADEQEPVTPILSLCHGIFTDWSIFSTPFLLWKKGSSGPVTQWRQLVSCDWLWHSHGSLIQSRFDLKINRSMKTPWQEYSWVACSYSYAPDRTNSDDCAICIR